MNFAELICGLRGRHEWKVLTDSRGLLCSNCGAIVKLSPRAHPVVRLAEMRQTWPPLPPLAPHLRFVEYIGAVRVNAGNRFGAWGPGGPEQGRDDLAITHVRLVEFNSHYPIVPRDVTLSIGREFVMNLDSASGVDLACSGEDRKGWINLRYAALIAANDAVFTLSGPTDLEVRLDVIANIARRIG